MCEEGLLEHGLLFDFVTFIFSTFIKKLEEYTESLGEKDKHSGNVV